MMESSKITAIVSCLFFVWVAPLHADSIPGTTASVDPFVFQFNASGNGTYQTSVGGVTTSPWTFSPGSINENSSIGPLGFLTYQLPAATSPGDIAIINPADLKELPRDTIVVNGLYSINPAEVNPNVFIAGLRFLTVSQAGSQQSYLQFYSSQAGFPSGFAESVSNGPPSKSVIFAVLGTVEADGSIGFSYDPGESLGVDDNTYKGLAPDLDPVPEPSSNVASFGLLGMGLVGTLWHWRKQPSA